MHTAHLRGQLKRTHNVIERIAVQTLMSEGTFRFSGGDDAAPVLSFQRIAIHAIGETARKNPVQPLFQQRRTAIGIERMLKNDDIMFTQQLLFMVNIDKKIRIGCVQIVHGNVFQCLSRLQQNPIGDRIL